jgi:hypothetical protein
MLGELIFESKGKVMGQRVLSVEDGIPKIEISVSGTGKIANIEVNESWTYWAIQRLDGTSYGECRHIICCSYWF